jgi:hypothetical protein
MFFFSLTGGILDGGLMELVFFSIGSQNHRWSWPTGTVLEFLDKDPWMTNVDETPSIDNQGQGWTSGRRKIFFDARQYLVCRQQLGMKCMHYCQSCYLKVDLHSGKA